MVSALLENPFSYSQWSASSTNSATMLSAMERLTCRSFGKNTVRLRESRKEHVGIYVQYTSYAASVLYGFTSIMQ